MSDAPELSSTKLEHEVRQFVAEEIGVPLNEVLDSSCLEEDFGLTGDDAADFLRAFAEHFAVNLEGIIFHKHFGPEGFNPLWIFMTPDWLKDHGFYPVTVQHLILVAQTKRWFEPPRISSEQPCTLPDVQG